MSAKEHLYGRKRRPSNGREGTRTALYLRVSTADQKPDLQYDGLRAYAAHASLEVVQDYCDVGVSGRREGRPQLNALMAAVRNREIDCVLVWKFDRFARSTRHLLTALEEFNHLGVRFISVQDQVDTDSPMGRVMFTIIGAMAELECSLVSERVTAGMRAAESRGKHLGRPATQQRIIREIETLATSTDLSIRQIQSKIAGRASRSVVGEVTKRARSVRTAAARSVLDDGEHNAMLDRSGMEELPGDRSSWKRTCGLTLIREKPVQIPFVNSILLLLRSRNRRPGWG